MEIKQLEIFLCVARSLSFSKAADIMHMSQPTVSTCIGSLEKYLGVQLLLRNTKEVSLTKAGLDFLTYAQNIISIRDWALHSVNGEVRDAKGVIEVESILYPGVLSYYPSTGK